MSSADTNPRRRKTAPAETAKVICFLDMVIFIFVDSVDACYRLETVFLIEFFSKLELRAVGEVLKKIFSADLRSAMFSSHSL